MRVPPPKLIYVLGCNHALQVPPDESLSEEFRSQIEDFCNDVKHLAQFYRFDLYCEDIRQSAFSNVERIAINRRKRYLNMDMPKDMRTKFGIPLDYADPRITKYGPKHVLDWHAIREEYMFQRATDRMTPATVGLVICGHEHMVRLTERFKTLEGHVESKSILDSPWYRKELYTGVGTAEP
jgi:hypothetical protein